MLLKNLRTALSIVPPTAKVVLAVSGGSDSMALLHLACEVLKKEQLIVAHFNHGLRTDSISEENHVQWYANSLGIPFISETWVHEKETASENLCREYRYGFLIKTAEQTQSGFVLTAHHQNDQAETFLDRLFRGSGVKGLSSMRTVRPLTENIQLVRPLLSYSKEELVQWLQQREIHWMEDSSNQSLQYKRNRIRHNVLPCLEDNLERDPTPTLYETTKRLQRADEALEWVLQDLTSQVYISLWRKPGYYKAIEERLIKKYPEEIQCRFLSWMVNDLLGDMPVNSRAQENFLIMLKKEEKCWKMEVKGMTITLEDGYVIFYPKNKP